MSIAVWENGFLIRDERLRMGDFGSHERNRLDDDSKDGVEFHVCWKSFALEYSLPWYDKEFWGKIPFPHLTLMMNETHKL